MRRFAALFKRDDKPAPTTVSAAPADTRSTRTSKTPSVKKPSRFFRSLSVKAVKQAVIREPPPSVPQPPLQASSFSTSSTESPAPATPDDDSEFGSGAAHRNSNQWSERGLALPLPATGGSLGWDPLPKPSLSLPPILSAAKPSYSEDSDDTSSATSSPPSVSSPLPVSPRNSLHSLTTYALAPTFSAPPLLSLPNVPLFPRSANSISSLPHQETVATMFFRSHILRRLDGRDISASEERSIASFTSRRRLPVKSQFLLSKLDDEPVCDLKRVSNVSHGLKRWISRPCFEDRMSVYTPGPSGRPDDIVVHSVSGGAFGVAALEVSESIEVLAGYNIEEKSETPWLPALILSSTTDVRLPTPATHTSPSITPHTQTQPQKPDPSLLRTEATPPPPSHTKAPNQKQPSLQSSLSRTSPPSTSPTNVTHAKRVRSSVRFDVDEKQDKDEHVPLGQIMRIKRGREERAKFLELEKERRALTEERQKYEAEKRKWEQERQAWEAERKLAEEEKKKRLYQQEVIAARKRRESQMFKVGASSSDAPEIEPQSSRRQGSYQRPAYDNLRQQNLDGSSPAVSHPPSRDDSFGSLRGTSKPQSLHSVPPPSGNSSNTGSSNEDVAKLPGRPISMLPGTTAQLPMMMQPYSYPWGMPMIPVSMSMQMVPQMPYYPVDNTPLLPPTAPFMMQQAGNRRNSASGSPNRSSSSLGRPGSQSVDRLPLNQGTSPNRRSAGHQRSSSGGSSNQLGSGQRSNAGSISSRRSSVMVNDPSQWRNSTRSRPQLPQSQSHRPGSWVVPSPTSRIRQNTVT